MSNNLKFDFDKPLGNLNTNKEQENLVIQCEFCQTRYSIPSAGVLAANAPKFHCFSCDNIFEVNLNQSNIIPPVVPSAPKEQFSFLNKTEPTKQNDLLSTNKLQQSVEPSVNEIASPTPASSAFGFNSSLKVTSKSPLTNVRIKKEQSVTAGKVNFAMSNRTPDLSIRNIDPAKPSKSFVFTDFQKSISDEMLVPRKTVDSSVSAWKMQQQISSFQMPKLALGKFLKKFSFSGTTTPKIVKSKLAKTKFTVAKPKLELSNFAIPTMPKILALSARNFSLGISAKLLMVLLPVVIVLAFLYFLTSIILSSPQSFSGYFAFASQSTNVYPLPGVGVKELELKLVKLDNGEDVKLLSGKFYNNSEKAINNPVIEGVLFDTKGQIIARSFHTLDKDLTNVQYGALDLKTLTELPNSKEKDKFQLLPNQKQSFTFALLADSNVQPTYFAGRVYSIS